MPLASKRPRHWWLALVQIALLLVTMATPAVGAALPAPMTGTELIQLLQTYSIVRGDQNGDLNLDKPITRAEMITIMVRALGAEEQAKVSTTPSPFADTKGHWAEANIAYAASRNLVKGDGNGFARPNDPISYAEALTLALRVVQKEPTAGDWPMNVLLEAANLGLNPEGVTMGNINQPAIRRQIFGSLAKGISTVTTPVGRTYLQTYVDPIPPVLALTTTSTSTTADKIRVEGSVDGASSVTVNGVAATIVGKVFYAEFPLTFGANVFKARAVDPAGNEADATVTITRASLVETLEFTGPAKVGVGATATYSIVAKDANGQTVSASHLTAQVEGNIGTFSVATGTFQASATAGAKGKITVTAGTRSHSVDVEILGTSTAVTGLNITPANGGQPVAFTQPMTVTVTALNGEGQVVATDFGRAVTLAATGVDGLTVTPAVAYTSAGSATFTVKSTQPGTVALAASSAGLPTVHAAAKFGTTTRIVLVSDPTSLSVGGAQTLARIKAELRDEKGELTANNTGAPITIQLISDMTNGSIVDETLVIERGLTSSTMSGNDGLYAMGEQAGTVPISGVLVSNHDFTVVPTSVKITVPTIGAGTKLVVFPPVSPVAPGAAGTYAVRLQDAQGNLISTGSFAFQLKVDTSFGATKTAGIPENVEVYLGDTLLVPVSDGITEGATNDTGDIIARTIGGVALIRVISQVPGQITLTPIPMGSYATAYSYDGVDAPAASSQSFGVEPGIGVVAATPTALQLTVDSALGNGQEVGAMTASNSANVTLHVTVTDSSGYWIPGWVTNVTLQKVAVDNVTTPVVTSVATADGKATFQVKGSTTAGYDNYRVTATLGSTSVNSNLVPIYTQSAKPAQPTIINIRGVNNGVPGNLDYIEADDTHMEIEFLPIPTEKWVQVRVFSSKNTSTPIYTSPAFDIGSGSPRLLVPKKVLPAGVAQYQVDITNGFTRSDRSAYYALPVTNAVYSTGIAISTARYDAVNKKLFVSGSGFSAADTVDPSRIVIRDASTSASAPLAGAVVTVSSSSSMVLNLSDASLTSLAADLANRDLYAGRDVKVYTENGWYRRNDGTTASPDSTGKLVTPMARLSHAEYDRANKRVLIYGEGFTTGTINFSKMKLSFAGATTAQEFVLSTLGASRVSDTQLSFSVSATTVFNAIDTNGSYEIVALDGWMYDSSALQVATSATIYANIRPTSVSYNNGVITVSGSGFGGTLDLTKLSIQDESQPSGDILQLSGNVADSSITATTITIELNSTGKSWFETKFSGSDIYLIGETGWLVKDGREATATAYHSLRFPTFTP